MPTYPLLLSRDLPAVLIGSMSFRPRRNEASRRRSCSTSHSRIPSNSIIRRRSSTNKSVSVVALLFKRTAEFLSRTVYFHDETSFSQLHLKEHAVLLSDPQRE